MGWRSKLRAGSSSLLSCCLATAGAVLVGAPTREASAQTPGKARSLSVTLPIGVLEQDVGVALVGQHTWGQGSGQLLPTRGSRQCRYCI